MECSAKSIDDVVVVSVSGRVDHKSSREFEAVLKPHLDVCIAGDRRKMVIDLAGVDYMSSAGLRVLMMAARTGTQHKARIVVAALQPTIEEVFRISRFNLVLQVHPSVQEAVAALA
jgi:anti-anti-sigma factor